MSIIEKGEAVTAALAAAFEGADVAVAADAPNFPEAVGLLRGNPLAIASAVPRRTAACAHWDATIAAAEGGRNAALAAALADFEPVVAWMPLTEMYDDSLDVDQGFGMVIGPWGSPLSAGAYGFGLLLMGPNTLYPRHHHVAREVYYVVSGTADWMRGDEDWAPRAPGSAIYHPSEVPHAMRTGSEPLLAVASWISDLDSSVVLTDG
jgi:mannose-6-phosphate isomerase-like protein (cupin superfamily)